jgi:hypothetical protein
MNDLGKDGESYEVLSTAAPVHILPARFKS